LLSIALSALAAPAQRPVLSRVFDCLKIGFAYDAPMTAYQEYSARLNCSSARIPTSLQQRGFWTHTKNGLKYFDSVTGGWIDYSHNHLLVKLFSHALLSTSKGHEAALLKLKEDIEEQKRHSQLR
jgi:hypothetical protein